LNGYEETRKTFIWKTLFSTIRSQGKILITVHQMGHHLSFYQDVE